MRRETKMSDAISVKKVSVTVTFMLTALMLTALAAIAFFVGWILGSVRIDADAALRENAQLVARQQALRDVTLDLAEQVRWYQEKGRLLSRLAGTSEPPWDVEWPLPPAQEADNEAVLDWLSELGSLLEPSERPVPPDPPGPTGPTRNVQRRHESSNP